MAEDIVVPPPPPPAPPAKPWYEGKADADTVGVWQNKGWADKDAATVAVEATKSYREAERLIGAPPDKIVRLPDKADDPAWADVWKRFGAPAEAKDYDFANVKRADGTALPDALVDSIRTSALAGHLSKDAAAQVAASVAKYLDTSATNTAAEKQSKIVAEKEALTKNWGANFEANRFIASQAAQKLGFTPEEVAALEGLVGYSKIMDSFRKIGMTMGEDKFVAGAGLTQNGVMTREQAQARITDLKNDKLWAGRYLAGGAVEKNEMGALMAIISA